MLCLPVVNGLGVLAGIARPAQQLQVVDVISATLDSGDHMVHFQSHSAFPALAGFTLGILKASASHLLMSQGFTLFRGDGVKPWWIDKGEGINGARTPMPAITAHTEAPGHLTCPTPATVQAWRLGWVRWGWMKYPLKLIQGACPPMLQVAGIAHLPFATTLYLKSTIHTWWGCWINFGLSVCGELIKCALLPVPAPAHDTQVSGFKLFDVATGNTLCNNPFGFGRLGGCRHGLSLLSAMKLLISEVGSFFVYTPLYHFNTLNQESCHAC